MALYTEVSKVNKQKRHFLYYTAFTRLTYTRISFKGKKLISCMILQNHSTLVRTVNFHIDYTPYKRTVKSAPLLFILPAGPAV